MHEKSAPNFFPQSFDRGIGKTHNYQASQILRYSVPCNGIPF